VVADSVGKEILWQKQFRIPYRSANGSSVDGYRVAAKTGAYAWQMRGGRQVTLGFIPKAD